MSPQDGSAPEQAQTPHPGADRAFWDNVGAACLLARWEGRARVPVRDGWAWTASGLVRA